MPDDEKVDVTMSRKDDELKTDMQNWRRQDAKDPFLVVLSGMEKGKKILLISACTSMGRSSTCNIQVKDQRASRTHASIEKRDEEFVIVDHNSSNGTWVNGEKITSRPLKSGDHIVIGSTELLLTIPA